MFWIAENVASSLIATLLALLVAFLVYLYRQRPMITVEIVIDSGLAKPTTKVVITNHGRAPTVITELNVHMPLGNTTIHSPLLPGIATLEPSPLPPQWFKVPRCLWLRRKLRVFGSHNDMLTSHAKLLLADGSVKHDVLNRTETINVMPNEKASRLLEGRKSHPLTPKMEKPLAVVLIPSCRVAKQKNVVWGKPVIVSQVNIDGYATPLVISYGWGVQEPRV